jgi:hypothetical protein
MSEFPLAVAAKRIWSASGDHAGSATAVSAPVSICTGSVPSACILQRCPFRMKAMSDPSGDHAGSWSVPPNVSWTKSAAVFGPALPIQRLPCSSKTTRVPSGE